MQVKEYKRTCKECGKVWHSLVSREQQVITELENNFSNGLCSACCCQDGSQYIRNKEANESELNPLKKCPECQSSNYNEEIITFEK